MNYWWFGINNKKTKSDQSKSHVIFSEIEPFFKNKEKFAWPYGGRPKSLYQQMATGDKVILWMGDGHYQKEWGILGIAQIESVSDNFYWISPVVVPEKPFKPYVSGKPGITKETEKLKDIFGLNFKALQKVCLSIGYISKPNNIATTIDKVSKHQYDQTLFLLIQEIISEDNFYLNLSLKEKEAKRLSLFELKNKIANTAAKLERVSVAASKFSRNPYIVEYAKRIANGICQDCKQPAPFVNRLTNEPFLETHHITPLAQGGLDTIENTIAICPNCHRKRHYG